jgi:hypothetical protein
MNTEQLVILPAELIREEKRCSLNHREITQMSLTVRPVERGLPAADGLFNTNVLDLFYGL